MLLDDPFTHRLLFRGRSVRGDPRRHMKKCFQHARFELATLVPKGGIIPELIRSPTPFSALLTKGGDRGGALSPPPTLAPLLCRVGYLQRAVVIK